MTRGRALCCASRPAHASPSVCRCTPDARSANLRSCNWCPVACPVRWPARAGASRTRRTKSEGWWCPGMGRRWRGPEERRWGGVECAALSLEGGVVGGEKSRIPPPLPWPESAASALHTLALNLSTCYLLRSPLCRSTCKNRTIDDLEAYLRTHGACDNRFIRVRFATSSK